MKKHFLIMTIVMMNFINLLVGTNSNPTMSRIYGNQFTPGIADTQLAGEIGYLVPTGIFGINGSINLAAQVPNAQAVAVQVLANGVIAVAFNDGTNTYIVQYTSQGAVFTGFAIGTGNIFTLPGNLTNAALSMTVDEQGRLLISGAGHGGSSLPWIRRIKADGSGVDTSFTFLDGSSWGTSGQINQIITQTSGKIMAVGYNGTHGMIARYNLNGLLDQTFAAAGYLTFNGSTSGTKIIPVSTDALYNIIIDAQNNIYVAYVDVLSSINVIRFATSGIVDVSWNSGNPVNLSYLNESSLGTMVPSQLRMVLDSLSDIIVAVPSGSPTVINATSITSATGAAGTFANFTTSGGVFGSDNYALFNMMADSNGSVYFIGSDTTKKKMAVIRCASTGGTPDPTFNNGIGINFFWPSGSAPSGYANSNAGALAPDGQIFIAGAQLNSGTTTPYLSSLYNNQYVTPVAQFPVTQEQGTTDVSFGSTSQETYPGVVSPYIGLYRNSLVQKAEVVIELASGNILVGMNGKTNSSPIQSMMVVTLDQSGITTAPAPTVFPNTEGIDEYITDVIQDGSGNIYVSGYSAAGALFRLYPSNFGNAIWNSDFVDAGVGYQGLGIGLEGSARALLFLGGPSNTGQINSYSVATGTIDTTFNGASAHPGSLHTGDFGLNIGTLHNGIIGKNGEIFIAYRNTVTGNIDTTCLYNPASAVAWTESNVFNGYSIAPDDVRISFNKNGNVVVAASLGSDFLVTVLNATTGIPVPLYSSPLVISCGIGTSIVLRQVIGISNGAIVLVGYDSAGDGAMIVARVSSAGVVDITFDSQGPIQGVASLKIGDQIADFYARVASGIAVQSHTGSNQGNLIVAGYEQMFATSSIPMILRLFGMPGTMQVPNFPFSALIPGNFDITYGNGGVADTYALGTPGPTANQEVRSIRELPGINLMTIITDNNTFISYTERLNQYGQIDTTYGSGLGVAIAQPVTTPASTVPVPPTTTMMETVNNMVYDGEGNMLIVGSNAIYGGYLKRVLVIDGSMDPLFGGPTGQTLADNTPYPVGTAYGLMTTVNACQQLNDSNIVIVGSNNGVGTIAIVSSTGLPLSSITTTVGTTTTVTPFGMNGQVTQGVNATSVSVDALNNMYVAISYLDTDAIMKAGILKLTYPSGSPDQTFGTNGFVGAAISGIDDYDSLRLAFDASGNIIIAASIGGTSGQVVVNRFTPAGVQDSNFNGGAQLVISFVTPTNVIVTGLSVLWSGQILISGYQSDSNPANNYDFIACLTNAGELDPSFGSVPGGLVTFQAPDGAQLARRLVNLNVQTDGNILLCGGDVPAINEETPLTFRLYGYPNVQPVPQFTGYQIILPNVLNKLFNPNGTTPGIAVTDAIPNLSQLGNVVVDTLNRPLISGIASTGGLSQFVVARYINSPSTPQQNGTLDLSFGTAGTGIATSITGVNLLSGGYLAADTLGFMYIGGVTATSQFVVARLTSDGILDTNFGIDGIGISTVIPNLTGGGFVAIDLLNRPVIGGYTSDDYLVATRFTTDGNPDHLFAGGLYAKKLVNALVSGGSIVTDSDNSVYIGCMTSTSYLEVVKFDDLGAPVVLGYGIAGIASSGAISTGLVDGGSIGLDSNKNIVIGGLNFNQQFVVARFTSAGALDPTFNNQGATYGIAYSAAVNVLNIFGSIAVNSSNNIVASGVALAHDGSLSMVVAGFTSSGVLDNILSILGVASTGTIPNLITGGVVTTDRYNNIFIGGLTNLPGFVLAEMYSGAEIFISNPTTLPSANLQGYFYGTNKTYFTNATGVSYFASFITDPVIKAQVVADVNAQLATFFALYQNQPGLNPLWLVYRKVQDLKTAQAKWNALYPTKTAQINRFFLALEARLGALKYSLTTTAGLKKL